MEKGKNKGQGQFVIDMDNAAFSSKNPNDTLETVTSAQVAAVNQVDQFVQRGKAQSEKNPSGGVRLVINKK